MLPNSKHDPIHRSQQSHYSPITKDVFVDLLDPKGPIRRWDVPTTLASMPETAIHKNGDLLLRKDKVGLTDNLRVIPAPTLYSIQSKDFCKSYFRGLVPLPLNGGHHLGALLFGEYIRHST
jgi:hypothetical protein